MMRYLLLVTRFMMRYLLVVAMLAAGVVAAFLGAGIANAQDVPAAVPEALGDGTPWWAALLIGLATTLGPILIGLLGRWLHKLTESAAERSKLDFLRGLDELAIGVVTELFQVGLKAAKQAAPDGKLTAQQKAEAKRGAI